MKYTFLLSEGKHLSNAQLLQKINNEIKKRKANQKKREERGSLIPVTQNQRKKKDTPTQKPTPKQIGVKDTPKQDSKPKQIGAKNEWGYRKYQQAQASKVKPDSFKQQNNNQTQNKPSKSIDGKTIAKYAVPATVVAAGTAAIYAWLKKKNKNKKRNKKVA